MENFESTEIWNACTLGCRYSKTISETFMMTFWPCFVRIQAVDWKINLSRVCLVSHGTLRENPDFPPTPKPRSSERIYEPSKKNVCDDLTKFHRDWINILEVNSPGAKFIHSDRGSFPHLRFHHKASSALVCKMATFYNNLVSSLGVSRWKQTADDFTSEKEKMEKIYGRSILTLFSVQNFGVKMWHNYR